MRFNICLIIVIIMLGTARSCTNTGGTSADICREKCGTLNTHIGHGMFGIAYTVEDTPEQQRTCISQCTNERRMTRRRSRWAHRRQSRWPLRTE
ncbi:unnamed protein product [Dicrocoelium dendriticum]|nr:unnamed protein product [Dicrocoelium dendriticum]